MPRHEITTESATGLGSKAAKKQKVKAGKSNIWNPNVCYEVPAVATKTKTMTKQSKQNMNKNKRKKAKTKTKTASSSNTSITSNETETQSQSQSQYRLPIQLPPPSCSVEFLRMGSSNHLRKQLTKLRKSYRTTAEDKEFVKHAVMAVERWWMRYFLKHPATALTTTTTTTTTCTVTEDDNIIYDDYDYDPVIPNPSDGLEIEAGFVNDLVKAGDTEEAAEMAVKAFYKLCQTAVSTISEQKRKQQQQQQQSGDTNNGPETVLVVRHKHSCDVMLSNTKTKTKNKAKLLKINPAHYDKLKDMYTRQQKRTRILFSKNKGNENEEEEDLEDGNNSEFHRRLFCVLARYHSIQGHGFQAACTEHVFDVLHGHFGVNLECFASPLNSRYALHCSAFPDTDACFGSLGSFFNFYPTFGSFEANPPFEPTVMLAMVKHMELLFSKYAEGPLSFVVVVPGWSECEAFRLLKASPFTRTTVPIAQADHGFCDGASHQRRDRYRISPYDTFFFFLQNEQASKKWPVTDTAISELRAAMANGVPSPSMQARHDKAGRGTDDIARGVYKGKKSKATGDGVMKRKRDELLEKKKKHNKTKPKKKKTNTAE